MLEFMIRIMLDLSRKAHGATLFMRFWGFMVVAKALDQSGGAEALWTFIIIIFTHMFMHYVRASKSLFVVL